MSEKLRILTLSDLHGAMNMKFLVSILVLLVVFCLSKVNGDCPRRDDLHCNMYDTDNCPPGTKVRNTFIKYKGKSCDACRMCLPESAQYGCPDVQCPYERLQDWYPMDCGIVDHPQFSWIGDRKCSACATFTKYCSDLSWIG